MKTGFKIFILSVALILLVCCTAGVFLLVIAPTTRLQSDYDSFSALDSALAGLQTELQKTRVYSFDSRIPAIEKALDRSNAAFKRIDTGSFIRQRNETASKAIAELPAFRETIDTGTKNILARYTELRDLAVRTGASGNADLSAASVASLLEGANAADARLPAAELNRAVIDLSGSIDTIRNQIDSRLPVVADGIRAYRTLSFLTSGAIIICTWLLGLMAVWLLARSVSRITRHFTSILDSVSEGNIDGYLHEINGSQGGELLGKMTRFLGSLRTITDNLKSEVSTNVESSTQLSESLGNTASTFEVVDGFIESIRNEVMVLESQVKIVKTGLARVTSGLSHLDTGIVNQKSVVEGSMVSVNGMIRSISEMADAAIRDEKLVQRLVHSSETGQTLFSSTYQKITLISESISRINGMAAVIENIAEQTNMLALNAAIEAAHAGDAGQGFAVVAEEMTKLAEASTESSREIAESIQEIVENITTMASSSSELDRAFEAMSGDISLVHDTMVNFSSGLTESNHDSQQVLETMNTLQSVSNGVTEDSGTMSEGALAIEKSMSELDMISSRVFDGITAMSLMLDGLKEVIQEFKILAQKMKASGLAMSDELGQLK